MESALLPARRRSVKKKATQLLGRLFTFDNRLPGSLLQFLRWRLQVKLFKIFQRAYIVDAEGNPIVNIRRILKGFTLFNDEQCADMPTETIENRSCSQEQLMEPNVYQAQAVDALLTRHSVEVRFGGNDAFYDRHCDFIGMPEKAAHTHGAGEAYYYSTLLHELTHWTGHPTRMNRPGIADTGSPKLEVEAVEELIAEIGSAFLCAEFEIRNNLRHKGLVLRWIRELEEDPRAIFKASCLAWKARCFLLGDES